jgi:hypothetical protein
MSLVRSHKEIPAELRTERAWIDRMRTEPHYTVLADAYEYGLWYLNSDGCCVYAEHPINNGPLNYLYSNSDAYNDALIEVMRRNGFDPYSRIVEDVRASGASDELCEMTKLVQEHALEGVRTIARR